MERTDEMVALLEEFTVLGVNLAVDDFGTGLLVAVLPLALPRRHPEDRPVLRRGGRAVGGADRAGPHDRPARARHSTSSTVAEGIELAHQAEALAAMGCTYGQGFYFAPPLTSDELDVYLADGAGYALTESDRRPARGRPEPPPHPHLWRVVASLQGRRVTSRPATRRGGRGVHRRDGGGGYVAGVGEDGSRADVQAAGVDVRAAAREAEPA